jgi:hypothetical protein
MKKYTLKEILMLIIELIFLASMIILTVVILSSCCRPATAHQVQKWESRHKFESPGGFWGLHIFQKKNVYKY